MVLLLLVSILHWEMAYSVRIVLRKYKPNSMGYHILQLCVTKNSCRKRISLKLYVDMVYLTTDHIQPMTDYDTLLYNQDTTQKNNKRLFRICKVCRQINPCIQMTRQTLDM